MNEDNLSYGNRWTVGNTLFIATISEPNYGYISHFKSQSYVPGYTHMSNLVTESSASPAAHSGKLLTLFFSVIHQTSSITGSPYIHLPLPTHSLTFFKDKIHGIRTKFSPSNSTDPFFHLPAPPPKLVDSTPVTLSRSPSCSTFKVGRFHSSHSQSLTFLPHLQSWSIPLQSLSVAHLPAPPPKLVDSTPVTLSRSPSCSPSKVGRFHSSHSQSVTEFPELISASENKQYPLDTISNLLLKLLQITN